MVPKAVGMAREDVHGLALEQYPVRGCEGKEHQPRRGRRGQGGQR